MSTDSTDTAVIQTVIQADGLGRASRTAKTGVVYDRSADTKRTGWNISGAVAYDEKGRVIKQGQPYFIEGGMAALSLGSGAVTATMVRPTLTEYDGLDRVTKTTLSDGSVQSVLYDVTDGGEPQTRTTDPLGNMSVQRTDPAGNIIYVERQDKAGKKLTWADYAYDATGQMLRATDAKGNAITAEYDLLGRKLSLASVDGGRREYKYDAYRLLEETGPNLRAKGKWIGYEYDGLSRLVKVDYPETAATVYTYGAPGAADNAAGRVTQVTDASGTIKYKYGKLGEVTEETRTLSVKSGKQGETMTATTGYLSNYLGQMERISYPDGETVDYGYDAGGQVIRVSGRHYDSDFSYVSDIGYGEFGQRSYICYGNGVRTDYEYDPHRRWLSSIGTVKGRTPYQSISYSFDRVGNVLGYKNDCTAGGDYATSQSYAYDDLYQLVRAEGKTAYNPYKGTTMPVYESTYTQEFTFDILGNMTDKVSRETVRPVKVIGDELNYTKEFSYAEGFAHRIDHIAGTYYEYDLDGNVCALSKGGQSGGASAPDGGSPAEGGDDDGWGLGDGWDDGDDGWGLGDDDWGATGDYEYNLGDGSGSSGGWGGDDGDGWGLGDDDWGGTGDYVYNLEEPEHDDGSMTLASYVWDERDRMIKSVNSTATAYYVYGEDGERTNKYTADSETLYFSRLWTWHGDKSIDDQVSKHIYLGETRIVSKLNSSGKNGSYGEERGKTYFYHPDHLGSAQLITDYKGDEYQRIEYTPYGEAWVDKIEDPLYVYMPYKFTGKELDAETGLYYYGARYLDPQTSVWLSTDPALGDYMPTAGADNSNLPGMGGLFNTTNCHLYHYAGNNPVCYIDPDGEISYAVKTGKHRWEYDYSSSIFWDLGRAGINFGIDFFPPLVGAALKYGNIGYGKLVGREILNEYKDWVDNLVSGLGEYFTISSYLEILGGLGERIIKNSNEITDFLKTEGKVFGALSMGLDAVSIGLVFSHKEEIELDQVIGILVGSELTSHSKKALENKYKYARGKIQELICDGAVSYLSDWKGTVKGVFFNSGRLNDLKDKLNKME